MEEQLAMQGKVEVVQWLRTKTCLNNLKSTSLLILNNQQLI